MQHTPIIHRVTREQAEQAEGIVIVMLGKRLEYQSFSYVELIATQVP